MYNVNHIFRQSWDGRGTPDFPADMFLLFLTFALSFEKIPSFGVLHRS